MSSRAVGSGPTQLHFTQGLYSGCIQLGAGTSRYLMPLLYARLDLWFEPQP
ncbi:MAG: hypothetical protein OEU26_13770 [Candidatus Tectomicrobia bacterium]|nr:hypothetical protein [Candidatus Tectomicrobia bacterium]